MVDKHRIGVNEKNKLIQEVGILKMIDHPNIVKVFEMYEDDHHFYIVSGMIHYF